MIPRKDVDLYEKTIKELQEYNTALESALERQAEQHCAEVEALQEEVRKWQKLANIDPLTGIYNQRGFATGLKKCLKKERPIYGVMVYIDFNNFKPVNDLYGHSVGDELLICFARTLELTLRSDDVWGRSSAGGDEFLVFLGDADSIDNAEKVMEKIRLRVKGGILTHSINLPRAEEIAQLFDFDCGYYLVTKRETPDAIIDQAEAKVPKLVEERRRRMDNKS